MANIMMMTTMMMMIFNLYLFLKLYKRPDSVMFPALRIGILRKPMMPKRIKQSNMLRLKGFSLSTKLIK